MIAYNTHDLDANATCTEAEKWWKKGLLTAEQRQAIRTHYNSHFYTPNVFLRICLAVLSWILICAMLGIGVIFFDPNNRLGTGVLLVFFGGVLFTALEYYIREKKYYQAGIDDALLHMALTLTIVGVCLLFPEVFDDPLPYFLIAFPMLLIGAIRYVDKLATVSSFACAIAILFLACLEIGGILKNIIPFVLMAFTGGTYGLVRKNKEKEELRFWTECLQVVEFMSLFLLYLAGNYFVVREGNELLLSSDTVAFSFLFYLFTLAIPVVYIYFGLKNKDRLMLWAGLLVVVLSVLTFKYYFNPTHNPVSITLAGAFLVIGSYLAIRYLKKGHAIYSYKEDDEQAFANAEALMLAQSFGTPAQTPEKDFQLGGGQFGGGGASSDY
jgi:uncharacterized membrane protein YgcG